MLRAGGTFCALMMVLCGPAAALGPVTQTWLEDFDAPAALSAWNFRQVEGQLINGPGGVGAAARLRYPRWRMWRGNWPAAILNYGRGGFSERDWGRYDRLRFRVHNENSEPAPLRLRLDDADGRRATRFLTAPPRQARTFDVPVAALAAELDVEHVVRFDLYMRQPATDFTVVLDSIRLEAYALDLQEAELRIDPFQSGQVQARALVGRRAWCQVQVLAADGELAAQRSGLGTQLEWDLGPAGLSTGSYQVRLLVEDRDWGAAPVVRPLGAFEISPADQRPEVVAWAEPTTRKVMLHSRPRAEQPVLPLDRTAAPRPASALLQVDMARNEYEGVQVVFLTRADSIRLELTLDELRHVDTGQAFPLSGCSIYQVGYVRTEKPKEYAVDFVGWWPDPLLPAATMVAAPGECMPVWISLRSRPDTDPGTYPGTVGVRMNDERIRGLPLEVRVHGALLPDSTTVRTAFSLYDNMLWRLHGKPVPAPLYRRYQEFIADHRLNVDHLYRRSPPRIEDLAHFSERGQLNAFNVLRLRADDTYDQDRLSEIAAVLDPYLRELRRRGLMHRAYIYGFDEARVDDFPRLERAFSFIKARYPDLRTMTTAREPGYGLNTRLDPVVDTWVPLTSSYDTDTAEKARARGRDVWWYICINPIHPHANWFVEYPALEARLLWWMAYQHHVPGFLYYCANRWPIQGEPIRLDGSNRTNWNPASFGTANGDGCLFYAGSEGPITTLRLENIRDGIEDYELLHMLALERGDRGERGRQLSAELIRSLTDFTGDVEHFAEVRQRLLGELGRVVSGRARVPSGS